ncbi:MAG: alanine racemase, partial [Deltaproteobacteria bacterium]|nr:alanine racemase [Deltaproteobacteria bacterium]
VVLRGAGLDAPILVLGYTPAEHAQQLIEFDLIQAVYGYANAEKFSSQAQKLKKKISVHIKIDSGMGRLGLVSPALLPEKEIRESNPDPVAAVRKIAKLKGLEIQGVFTHFATADSADRTYANRQLDIFLDFLHQLERDGLQPPLRHAANSAALIEMPDAHLDMVRPGIATYGLNPSDEINRDKADLKPVMSLKSRIIHLKRVSAGFNVSYGITYQTEKPTTIATVPVGYADGLNRWFSSRGQMMVQGQKVPIIGRVCMDLTILDVGEIDSVGMEDEVVIFGRQGNASITADDLASELNTINYEIVSTVMARVPRVYVRSQ